MTAPLDPICLFEVLAEHGVAHVVVGGTAAVLHGSPTATFDVDIVPSSDRANLVRLSHALIELEAKLRAPDTPEGIDFDPHPELLASMRTLNTVTRCGNLDLTFTPAAVGGFDQLAPRAVRVDLDGVVVNVASLDDVIRSKRAADRPKDRAVLPLLEALRDELEDASGSSDR